jgi:hypothetical protein
MAFYTLLKKLEDYIEMEQQFLQKLRTAHYAMKLQAEKSVKHAL